MIPNITEATPRIKALREYYMTNSPMVLDQELNFYCCHKNLLLYVDGWENSISAPTLRLRRSMTEAYRLANTRPVIFPGELIVGQIDFAPLTPEEQAKYDDYYYRRWNIIPKKEGRADHTALDYTMLLEKGVLAMIEMLDEKLADIDLSDGKNVARYEFYTSCKIELEGLIEMSEKYASEALRLASESEGAQKEEYLELARILKKVPARPAETFREALQSIHTYTWSLYGLYSYGKPDVYLLPYYRRDIENGILTPEKAQELIDSLFLMTIPNISSWAAMGFMLGGRDKDGNAVENELTWHFLTAIEHTHIPDPNIGFCVTEETSEEILHYAAKLIKDGHCQPQIWNCDEVIRSMISNGFAPEDARQFTLSTCVETTSIGCSGISITSPYINLPQIMLDALKKCDDSCDIDTLLNTFAVEFSKFCDSAILKENLWQLERTRNANDPMRASILIHDCLEKELAADGGGARYKQLYPNILGMQNVSESFNVIRQLVFEQKKVSLSELKKAIECDFEGFDELLYTIKNKTVHFGTGDAKANEMAKRVADIMLDTFSKMKTIHGANIIPGAFSYREHQIQGMVTGATPDGRRSGAPFNDGSNPVQGYDNCGPTLSIASTSAWEPSRFLGGIAINVKLSADVSPEKIATLIKGYLKTHCSQLQFNIVDPETLLNAQKNPDQYRDLLVRIGGYSDYFVRLPKSLQDDVISRSTNNI